jgi:RES domain-containing protein
LAALEQIGATSWSGTAYRHTAPNRDPLSGEGARLNGARWNAMDGSATIYLASPIETCQSELDRLLERQGSSVRLPRALHTIAVEPLTVVDLTVVGALEQVGLSEAAIDSPDWEPCQRVGEAVAYLGHQGLVAPSATGSGVVVAVYEVNTVPGQLIPLDSTPYP